MRLKERGFSLIELVVVIVLIGILAGVALPRLFQSTNSAYQAEFQTMVSTFQSSLDSLQADYLVNGKGASTYTQLIDNGYVNGAVSSGFASVAIPMTATGLPLVSSGGNVVTCATLLVFFGGVPSSKISLATTPNYSANFNGLMSSSRGLTYSWLSGYETTANTTPQLTNACIFYSFLAPASAGLAFYYSDAMTPPVGPLAAPLTSI